jgi:uncharacterized protein YjbI with pentapeptide repeats
MASMGFSVDNNAILLLDKGNLLIMSTGFQSAASSPKPTISASEIRNRIARANPAEPIRYENAIVLDDLDLTRMQCAADLSFVNCIFSGGFICESAVFSGKFELQSVELHSNVNLRSAEFQSGCTFEDLRVLAGLDASNALFNADLTLSRVEAADIAFRSAHFLRMALFQDSVLSGLSDFTCCHFGSSVSFIKTRFTGECRFQRCVVDGDFNLGGITASERLLFTRRVDLSRCRISGKLLMSHAVFESDVVLKDSLIESDLDLSGAEFRGGVDFSSSKFGAADCYGTNFSVKAIFNGVCFAGDVSFAASEDRKLAPARFAEADFTGAEIRGQAMFQGVTFLGETSFNGVRVSSDVYFCRDTSLNTPCSFGAKADFVGATIDGMSLFDGAEFKEVLFRAAHFGSDVSFEDCKFDGDMDFGNTEVRGNLFLKQDAFGGIVYLDQLRTTGFVTLAGSTFQKQCFIRAASVGDAFYCDPKESASAVSPARFLRGFDAERMTVAGAATFTNVFFGKGARLEGARFTGEVTFANAEFVDHAGFSDVEFRTVSFDGTKFHKTADFSGCTYERLVANWRDVLVRPGRMIGFSRNSRQHPYNRQPFIQLETYLRRCGEDRAADDVYLAMRSIEVGENFRRNQYVRGCWDVIESFVANYGIRPYRLIVFAALLLLFGTIIFSRPGMVVPSEKEQTAVSSSPTVLPLWEAFGVSVRQFLPIEVPIQQQWKPAPVPIQTEVMVGRKWREIWVRPAYISTFMLRIPGWVLVTLGVASLTGFLRRLGPN